MAFDVCGTDSASRNHCLWRHSTSLKFHPPTERLAQVDDRKQLLTLSLCERVMQLWVGPPAILLPLRQGRPVLASFARVTSK